MCYLNPCQMCSQWKNPNRLYCYLCGRKRSMPEKMSISEFSESMSKRGQSLL